MTRSHDGIEQHTLSIGTRQERVADCPQRSGVSDVVVGLVLFETGGELVGGVEDLLSGAGHGGHLRYFGRAGIAWMMMGPSELSVAPTSSRFPGGVGADEHRQAVIEVIDEDRVVEGVDHVVVVDVVLASARGDQRSIHASQVSLHEVRWQVILHAIPARAGVTHRPHEDPQPFGRCVGLPRGDTDDGLVRSEGVATFRRLQGTSPALDFAAFLSLLD